MTNTWTTKHFSIKIGRTDGKTSVTIAGNNSNAAAPVAVEVQPTPAPPVSHEGWGQVALIIVALAVLTGIWIRKYNKRSEDRVARSILWWR